MIEDDDHDVDESSLPLAERIAYVRWHSTTPATHLAQLATELAATPDSLTRSEAVSFAELVVSLRAVELAPAAMVAIEPQVDLDWVRQLLAELAWIQGRFEVVDALIRTECAQMASMDPDLQRRWLYLAARRGTDLLAVVVDALTGTSVLDSTFVEADLGRPVPAARIDAFVQVLAGKDRMDEDRARRCVDLFVDRAKMGVGFRSQVAPWFAFDTFSPRILTRVVDEALAAAERGEGYCAMRLGDGEAQVLAGVMPDLTGVLGVAPDKEWNELDDDVYARFRERMADAIRAADFVGVPDLVQCASGPSGYAEVPSICLEIGVRPERIVPGGCDLGWALEISGEADRLIAGCTGIIGPIPPHALGRFPADTAATWLPIPGELLYYYDEGGLETSHWSRFEQILAHDYRPGQVWLVAAGVLGKLYCHAIQRAGAVAVDIGSVLDVWAGRQDTRGTVREQLWVATPYLDRP